MHEHNLAIRWKHGNPVELSHKIYYEKKKPHVETKAGENPSIYQKDNSRKARQT